jgi:allantoinase
MPLNSIPATTDVEILERKREAARDQCLIDYAFWGGVVPGNTQQLMPLAKRGVRGFKCFLADSGVPEFARVNEADLDLAMPVIAETGLPLLVHAELPDPLTAAHKQLESGQADWTRHETHLRSRPPEAEIEAIALMIRLCRKYSCRVHIVHVSSAEALPLLKQAQLEGLPITAETCPHYLYFASEDVPAGATQFKCAPPIRDAKNRELLWEGLATGILDLIATDHSPCPAELKKLDTGDFGTAWGGIASLSVALPVVWTAVRQRGFGIADVCRWMCANPARLADLDKRKGQIAIGCDADFVIFDPDGRFQVTADRLQFRHPVCPYLGEQLHGEVRQVFVRGQRVFKDRQFAAERLGMEAISPASASM